MTMMLSLQGINKEFGEATILNNVNFNIALGDRIGLVGLNGSGKSTLANIIYGVLKPERGSILWYKKDIEIGYLKQNSFYSQRAWNGNEINIRNEEYIGNLLEISSYLGMDKIDLSEEEKISRVSE